MQRQGIEIERERASECKEWDRWSGGRSVGVRKSGRLCISNLSHFPTAMAQPTRQIRLKVTSEINQIEQFSMCVCVSVERILALDSCAVAHYFASIRIAILWRIASRICKWNERNTRDMTIISCSRFILMLAQFGFIAFHTYQGDSHVERV